MRNIYQPKVMIVKEVITEAAEVKSFQLKFQETKDRKNFSFKPGQFGEFSIFGEGELILSLTSFANQDFPIECCIKKTDKVSQAFHKLNIGDRIGFRGPYGNGFPLEKLNGRNLIFIAEGMGLAPLRSFIWACLDRREYFGQFTILYGAESVADFIYYREIKEWEKRGDVKLIKTVDPGEAEPGWDGQIGLVPMIMREIGLSPINAVAITSGSSVMIKYVIHSLDALGFSPDRILTSLEMKMKCGMGKCGHCQNGKYFVCQHGPVFNFTQLKEFPHEW